MRITFLWLVAVAALSTVAMSACGSRASASVPGSVAPAARPDTAAAAAAAPRTDTARRGYTEADVRFMQHMLAHHAQALVMTALVPERTGRRDLRLLAERMEVSQRDEIALMRRWLERRGEPVPALDTLPPDAGRAEHAGHGPAGHDAHARMPGMLGAAELQRLAAARGPEFERLFLEYMIRHHEGALVMVAELLASPGAAQDTETFQLASDVDADQRAEIRRMRALLDAMTTPPGGPSGAAATR